MLWDLISPPFFSANPCLAAAVYKQVAAAVYKPAVAAASERVAQQGTAAQQQAASVD